MCMDLGSTTAFIYGMREREHILDIFEKTNVLEYIEKAYGIFHCEGDYAVLEDVKKYIDRKGISIHV